jgi:hypothetical protein
VTPIAKMYWNVSTMRLAENITASFCQNDVTLKMIHSSNPNGMKTIKLDIISLRDDSTNGIKLTNLAWWSSNTEKISYENLNSTNHKSMSK